MKFGTRFWLASAATFAIQLAACSAQAQTAGFFEDASGRPLARFWLSWFDAAAGRELDVLTDSAGCAEVSATPNEAGEVEVRVHAHNPVVKVLDGLFIGQPGVSQVVRFRAEEVARIPDQGIYFAVAESFRAAYDAGVREFGPWENGEFANGVAARTSVLNLGVSVNDLSPGASWTDPAPIGNVRSLIHLTGTSGGRPGTAAHELGHGLHFSRLPRNLRERAGGEYRDWLIANIASPYHCLGRRTTPLVAYIEAFGMFSERYGVTPVSPTRHAKFFADEREYLETRDLRIAMPATRAPTYSGPDRFNGLDTDCNGTLDSLHGMDSDDIEGAVYGVIFVEFAADPAVGLDYAVRRYMDCGSLTLQE